MQLDFADVLLEVIDRRASDLHITAGAPPTVRVRGRLVPMDGFPVLTPNDTREIVYSILSEGQRQRFENNWQIDFAYQIPGRGRFRVNAYFQRSAVGAAFRLIPFDVVPLETLGLPAGRRRFREQAARAGPRDRPDGLGQVDHAGLADRRDQRAAAKSTS